MTLNDYVAWGESNMKKSEQMSKRGTTNYPFDPHKFFCKRCLKHHGCCPKTGKKGPARGCRL